MSDTFLMIMDSLGFSLPSSGKTADTATAIMEPS